MRQLPEALIPCGTLCFSLFSDSEMSSYNPTSVPRAHQYYRKPGRDVTSSSQVPDWMLSMKRERVSDRRKRESGAPRRDTIATVSKYDVRKKRHRQFMINDSKKAKALDKKS